jgi:HPt (histidine-containing phosphotransfer) domain-containing protein
MVTDLTYLTNMAGGNPEIVKEMIQIFIDQAQEYIVEMRKYLDEKDYLSLGRLAHKSKSSVAIMGMNDLAAELKILELLAKESNEPEKYPVMVDNFINQCKIAIEELRESKTKL